MPRPKKSDKKKETVRKPVDIITKRSLKDAVAKIKYDQPGTKDMPLKIRDRVVETMDEYEQVMKELFNQFSALEDDVAIFYAPLTNKKQALEIAKSIDEKSQAIANILSQMDEEDFQIFHKGYNNLFQNILNLLDRVQIVNDYAKFSNQSKKSKKGIKNMDIKDFVKTANISYVDKKEMMKGKKFTPADFVITKLIDLMAIEQGIENKEKINEQIEHCEQCFNDIATLTNDSDRRRIIFELLNGLLALPPEDIKAYTPTNTYFSQILNCAYDILTQNEEGIAKQIKKNMAPNQKQANIINCLLLEYAGYHLNDAYQKSIDDLRKEFSSKPKQSQKKMKPAVKAYLDECAKKLIEELIRDDIDEAVRPEIEREKKDKQKKRVEEKKKKDKEAIIPQKKLSKDEQEAIENFFKYVQNPERRGRGRPSKQELAERAKQEAFLKTNEEMIKEAKEKAKVQKRIDKEAEEKAKKEAAKLERERIKQEREKERQEKLQKQAQENLGDNVYEGYKQHKAKSENKSEFMKAIEVALADVDELVSKGKGTNVSLTISYENGKIRISNKMVSLPDSSVDVDEDSGDSKNTPK